MFTLNCKGKLFTIGQPLVMGIINATPDSFYRGDLFGGVESMVALAGKMIQEGASILDIGGQSTRPGSERIGSAQEIQRVIPVIEAIHSVYPEVILSIDTYHSEVAFAAVAAGASIVNDISAGSMDPEMIACVASLQVPYIAMHMKGTPERMQNNPIYEDLVKELLDFFIATIDRCKKAGIVDILIDPGFGFGKTAEQNFTLLRQLSVFTMLDKPLLVGLSRKSMVYTTLGVGVEEALNGSSVVNTMALLQGASILRVHDVKQAKEAVTLFTAFDKGNL
jgi:dihydropteroate synthase